MMDDGFSSCDCGCLTSRNDRRKLSIRREVRFVPGLVSRRPTGNQRTNGAHWRGASLFLLAWIPLHPTLFGSFLTIAQLGVGKKDQKTPSNFTHASGRFGSVPLVPKTVRRIAAPTHDRQRLGIDRPEKPKNAAVRLSGPLMNGLP